MRGTVCKGWEERQREEQGESRRIGGEKEERATSLCKQ